MTLRTKAMQKKRNAYQQQNGDRKISHARKEDIEKRRIVIDSNGAIIFKPVTTAGKIPAGEYFPTSDRSDNGVLIPIKRNQTINEATRIVSPKNNSMLNQTYSEDEERLSSIEDALLDHDFNFVGDDIKDQFIPVHSYFSMEDYNKGLQSAQKNISRFLHSKETYRELQMDYRRGILLYGDPGTGKSQFIYQLSKELIQDWEAVVIRIEGVRALDNFYNYVMHPISESTGRLKVIIIEELADLCSSRSNVSKILSLLDSIVLRENVLFLLTTNFPEKIPSNIVDRPARLDLLCPMYNKDFDKDFVDDWFQFCMDRPISEEEKNQEWYEEALGELSPAYYKELFIYSQLHDIPVNEAWQVIKERRQEIENDFNNTQTGGIGFNI